MPIAKVAIDCKSVQLDREYDYAVPEALRPVALPGARVIVPFGRGDRQVQGLILSLAAHSELASLKPIASVLDDPPLLDPELLGLVLLLRDRCFCTAFDALRAMLPAGIRFSMEQVLTPGQPAGSCTLTEAEREVLAAIEGMRRPTLRKLSKQLGQAVSGPVSSLLRKELLTPLLQHTGMAGETLRQVARLALPPEEVFAYLDGRKGAARSGQEKVVDLLLPGEPLAVSELCYLAGVSRSVVETLQKHGVIAVEERERLHLPYPQKLEGEPDAAPIALSPDQRRVTDGLLALIRAGRPSVALLHGVTGSGKTLCYLALVDEVMAQGGGAMILVPEIVLTPQLTDRFFGRYGSRVAVLHSGLSAGERRDEWRRIRRGDCPIVVGTRSAVFAPVRNLKLIVMDEEQEYAYKSESTPRYHARTVAKHRAAGVGATLLLCSATPSVETYAAAVQGRYHLFELQERYAQAALPEVLVTDLREELAAGLSPVTGPTLVRALAQTLGRGEQAILFLNRRGHHSFVSCRRCGHVIECPHCSISMTYHSANHRLMCHYCGHTAALPESCPACGQPNLSRYGFGTQLVESEMARLFPKARILRMDTDTTSTKMSHEEMLLRFEAGEYDILLGTQMVTKGLDFPAVSLVGVLFADSLLFLNDFRAGERAFSILTQVAGRAGRAELRGLAVIETFSPDNRIIELARRQDYVEFFRSELAFRKAAAYPPFCDIYLISFSAKEEREGLCAAAFFLENLRKLFQNLHGHSIILFPVTPAPIDRIGDQYRHRILIKCRDGEGLRRALRETLAALQRDRQFASVSCAIDLNPYNMF
ncbi:MAG: primosomal protein N' [Clostridiales bacterium]|nr:primosomal protein N' [Clostridiales bacterium]